MIFKRIVRSDAAQGLLCALAALYIRLAFATGRWRTVNGEIPRGFWDRGEPFIGCFWHGRILMMPCSWRRSIPIHMLISGHRDGKIIARVVSHFGIATIAGSTSKGGGAALRALVRAVRDGGCVGITPDGPRGPRMRASIGIAQIARITGAKVIPVAFSCAPRRLLSSWDRFVLALPFGRGVYVWGEPVTVAPDADAAALDEARRAIEAGLNKASREADEICGVAPVPPDEEEWTPAAEETDESQAPAEARAAPAALGAG